MGLEVCGCHGTTAALALLNDAVKKGGVMASSHVGGLSGAFIPVSEDAGMIAAAKSGHLDITKLESMTAVCSVGLDMIVVPGDITPETISAIIADEAAIAATLIHASFPDTSQLWKFPSRAPISGTRILSLSLIRQSLSGSKRERKRGARFRKTWELY